MQQSQPTKNKPSWLMRLRTALSLDLRSIALFRVLLALMILWDLLLRSQHPVSYTHLTLPTKA